MMIIWDKRNNIYLFEGAVKTTAPRIPDDKVTYENDLLFSQRGVTFAPFLARCHLLATSNVQR